MAVYLHVPFREPPAPPDESAFVAAVIQELERIAPRPEAPIRTVYVGGGRPSFLSDSALRTLLAALRRTLVTDPVDEATLELHPADASRAFLRFLHDLGFTRLSLDARSFVDDELRALGASHSVDDLRRLLRQSREAGIERLSVDLFFGGAGSSLARWKTTLHRAVTVGVPHLALHERAPDSASADEDIRAECFASAMTILAAKGYEQYELTHFARPGHRSRYQTHVYAHGTVLGLGPGAETFWWHDRSDPATAERWSNVADVATYVERLRTDRSPVAQRERLDRSALAREYLLLRLRTSEGLDLHTLASRYGCSLRDRRGATLDRLADEGLLHDDPDRVRLTPRGRLLADAVTRRLIRDA